MSALTQSHNNSQLGATHGASGATNSAPSGSPSGDNALLKAMLMQLLELSTLTNAATAESDLSVALRQNVQAAVTKNLEELQKLLSFCSTCEGSEYKKLYNLIKGGAASWSDLEKEFPNAHLESVPSGTRADFLERLGHLTDTTDRGHASEFRAKVGTLSTTLQQYGTYQTACKNLADGFQNGAGSLSQSITQFLAQLATEGGLMSDVVSQ